MSENETIGLFYQAGTSDKEYHVDLIKEGDLYRVDFRYGRRGSALRSGTKCKNGPIEYEAAKKLYDKIVTEQVRDGYQPGSDGAAFQPAPISVNQTGIVPQLLNPVPEQEVNFYLKNDSWLLQEKYDGHRRLIHSRADKAFGVNRKGIEVALPQELADIVAKAASQILLDGELMGSQFVAFDLLELNGQDLRSLSADSRLQKLEALRPKLEVSPNFKVIKTARTNAEKVAEFKRVRENALEGVVFKLDSSPYISGRPASGGDQIKHKFYETASFVIQSVSKVKSSVSLSLINPHGNIVLMGNVTVHVNQAMPVVGEVWEVRYLYAYPAGALCQPNLLNKRDDINAAECTLSQLKYAGDKESLSPKESVIIADTQPKPPTAAAPPKVKKKP